MREKQRDYWVGEDEMSSWDESAQLRNQGFDEEQIPAPSTMALILNRMGYRLGKVLKAKPQKAVRPRSGSPT